MAHPHWHPIQRSNGASKQVHRQETKTEDAQVRGSFPRTTKRCSNGTTQATGSATARAPRLMETPETAQTQEEKGPRQEALPVPETRAEGEQRGGPPRTWGLAGSL